MLTDLLSIGSKIIDKILPDKAAADEAKLKLLQLQQNGELEFEKINLEKSKLSNSLLQNQADINKIEAASENLFKSGWRPCIGWGCAIGITYEYVARPLLNGLLMQHGYNFPSLNTSELFGLTLSLLGLAGIRTFDKRRK